MAGRRQVFRIEIEGKSITAQGDWFGLTRSVDFAEEASLTLRFPTGGSEQISEAYTTKVERG